MITKTFKHENLEECKICLKQINTAIENYAIVIDSDGENIYSVGFYHRNCLRNVIKGTANQKVEQQISGIKKWGENLIGKILGKDVNEEQIFEIKT